MSNTEVFICTFIPTLISGILIGFVFGVECYGQLVKMNREFAKEREMEDWEP